MSTIDEQIVRDPDGYIIEVSQTTLARGWRPPS